MDPFRTGCAHFAARLPRRAPPPPKLEPVEPRSPQTPSDRIVKLNIGGRKFVTTLEVRLEKWANTDLISPADSDAQGGELLLISFKWAVRPLALSVPYAFW